MRADVNDRTEKRENRYCVARTAEVAAWTTRGAKPETRVPRLGSTTVPDGATGSEAGRGTKAGYISSTAALRNEVSRALPN